MSLLLCFIILATGDSKRHRKPWSELNEDERHLFISGFRKLADRGKIQIMSRSHNHSALDYHYSEYFLPWHRGFIYLFENEIRNLGHEYTNFSLPYWDFSNEPTPNDVLYGNETLLILHSGLGDHGNDLCISDDSAFDKKVYKPASPTNVDIETGQTCLIRNAQYTVSDRHHYYCHWSSPAQLMDIIYNNSNDFLSFTSLLEKIPHTFPHLCIGGVSLPNDGTIPGNLATLFSMDDPIFFLLHSFVDYLWTLWQQCNHNLEYYSMPKILEYIPYTSDSFTVAQVSDLYGDIMRDVSYEKGPFWQNAHLSEDMQDCYSGSQYFYNEKEWQTVNRRRLQYKSQKKCESIYDNLVEKSDPFESFGDLIHEWSVQCCEENGNVCELPDWNEFDDCSDMAINPNTNDIEVTLGELLNKNGLNECMKETRLSVYSWAKQYRVLRYLCAGCYDRFCDSSFVKHKCVNDAQYIMHSHDIPALMAPEIEPEKYLRNKYIIVGFIGVVLALMYVCYSDLYKGKPLNTGQNIQCEETWLLTAADK